MQGQGQGKDLERNYGQGFGGDKTSSPGGVVNGSPKPQGIYDQAKNAASEAYGIAAESASAKANETKSSLAGGLTSIADSLRKTGEGLNSSENQSGVTEYAARYTEAAAGKIEQTASYFERKDLREMLADAEQLARQNPAIFAGAAFALGLFAARFLKSKSPASVGHQTSRAGFRGPNELGHDDEVRSAY